MEPVEKYVLAGKGYCDSVEHTLLGSHQSVNECATRCDNTDGCQTFAVAVGGSSDGRCWQQHFTEPRCDKSVFNNHWVTYTKDERLIEKHREY